MPKQVGEGHYISLASSDNQEAILASTEQTIRSLQRAFPNKPLFLFEHGPGFVESEQIACGGCHMDHAHGHLLLLPEGTTLEPIQEHAEQILEYCGWTDIPNKRVKSTTVFANIDRVTGLRPYIHLGMITNNDTHSITYVQTSIDDAVEAQLLRRVISEVVYHHPERSYWHWRDITAGSTSKQRLNELKENVHIFSTIFR